MAASAASAIWAQKSRGPETLVVAQYISAVVLLYSTRRNTGTVLIDSCAGLLIAQL
jgi:hypothetical protein